MHYTTLKGREELEIWKTTPSARKSSYLEESKEELEETDKMEESSGAANTASEQNEQGENNDPTTTTKPSSSLQTKKRVDPKCVLFAFVVIK